MFKWIMVHLTRKKTPILAKVPITLVAFQRCTAMDNFCTKNNPARVLSTFSLSRFIMYENFVTLPSAKKND